MNRFRLSKAGVDANEGIKRFNNNRDMYEKFLLTFPDDVHYEKMITAIQNGQVTEAFQAAHALKGLSGNLSLIQLHSNIIPLVEELRAGSLVHAEELLQPVRESYEEVVKALEE